MNIHTWDLLHVLFYIVCVLFADQGNLVEMYNEFDTVMCDLLEPDNLFGLMDAASLLWRLNVAGVDPGEERWKRITDVCAQHMENCTFTW